MVKPFVPHTPQKQVVVTIAKREASLLQKLRKYPFGKFLVFKANNKIVRVEINDSQLIDEDVEIDLE